MAAIFQGLAEAREEQGEEGDSSAAVFAGGALGKLEEAGRRLLAPMLFGGAGHRFRGVVEHLRVEFCEDLNRRQQVADAGDAFGLAFSFGRKSFRRPRLKPRLQAEARATRHALSRSTEILKMV